MTKSYDIENRDEYNGWKNRETWAACLHMGNDYGLHLAAKEQTEYILRNMEETLIDPALSRYVGDRIISWFEELLDEGTLSTDEERNIRRDVGSFWRIDHPEVGNWALELVES